MGRIFNFEGPVFTFLSRLADLFWLNLLYILCCLPVITAGAATTALFYVSLKMAKDEEGYITRSFFKSFKENFVQATIIWILFLAVALILFIDLRIANTNSMAEAFNSAAVSNVVIVAVGVMIILIIMTYTYVFPLLAQFDNTVKNTVKNAFLISVRHLPYTFVMIVITVLPVVLIWFFPVLLIYIFLMFSVTAYINSKFLNRIFVIYMPADEPEERTDSLPEETNG